MLLAFFLLTFAITWSCWIPVAMGIPLRSGTGQALVYLGTYTPAIVALVLTRVRLGGRGVKSLAGRVLPVPVATRWVVFALSYTLALKLVAAGLCRLVSGRWPPFGTESLLLIPFAIAISTPFQAGEELGWRGFALPRLAERFGLAGASLVLGLVWALWHLPLFFVLDVDKYGQSFVVYTVQVVAISVAIAMLCARTGGGLFLPMLFHAAINNTQDVVHGATPGAHAVFSPRASPQAWLTTALLWMCTLFILAWMARTEPERRPQYAEWLAGKA
jgi:membrane protease YdiL (CAAX protease family)